MQTTTTTTTCDSCKSVIVEGQECVDVTLKKGAYTPDFDGSLAQWSCFANLDLCMPCATKPIDLTKVEWKDE